jgi:RNA polymerase sigma factor (TIGR02999 family)
MASPATSPAGDGARPIDELFSLAYSELRRLAARIRRDDRRATMTPTALVNEAWMKLAAGGTVVPASALHFKRLAARAMRQVLVEAARRRLAFKRGAGDAPLVTFDEALMPPAAGARDVLALDGALETLAALNARQAAVVECRFFAGLDVAETAVALEVSEATVLRDWRAARAYLAVQLRPAR